MRKSGLAGGRGVVGGGDGVDGVKDDNTSV